MIVKINLNKKRSFCYYNNNGKRVKIYNGKRFNIEINPNKEHDLVKRRKELEKLKKIIEKNLNPNSNNIKTNVYEQSIFNERVPISIFEHPSLGSVFVARKIADTIIEKQTLGEKCILGLATGSSPVSIYSELVRLHKEEGLSFQNVITFNLDEYWPIDKESTHSYHKFMFSHLFNHIDIKENNIHIPDGKVSSKNIEKYCLKYENKLK